MRSLWKDIWIALLMGMILPGLLLNLASGAMEPVPPQPTAAAEPAREPEFQPRTQPTVPQSAMYLRHGDGTVEQWGMEDYLVGVVLAEMPAWFEPEALRAQAVVARTYTQKAYETGGKHGDSSVCTQSACCQAYVSEQDYLDQGGSAENVEKVRSAVLETAGLVLTYGGELIEATYFSCSGGTTEDAVAVWGTDFPYLRSVSSPGEEDAAHFTDETVFSAAEFCAALGITPEGSPSSWLGAVTRTAGGGVETMEIGGAIFTGTQLRQLLGLRSTAITMAAGEDGIVITTKGYGHRVGMSQYGADAMAASGSTYPQILAHYYPGTALDAIG